MHRLAIPILSMWRWKLLYPPVYWLIIILHPSLVRYTSRYYTINQIGYHFTSLQYKGLPRTRCRSLRQQLKRAYNTTEQACMFELKSIDQCSHFSTKTATQRQRTVKNSTTSRQKHRRHSSLFSRRPPEAGIEPGTYNATNTSFKTTASTRQSQQ